MGSRIERARLGGSFGLRQGSPSALFINFRRRTSLSRISPKIAAAEELALKQAIATANEQISEIYEQVKKQSGKGQAAIFRAHLALLNDAEIFTGSLPRRLKPATVRHGPGSRPSSAARWS